MRALLPIIGLFLILTAASGIKGDEPRNDAIEYQDCGKSVPLAECFGWDQLTQYMSTRAYGDGVGYLPNIYKLVDIAMLGNAEMPEEVKDMEIEKSFFEKHPDRGFLLFWQVNGNYQPPEKMEPAKRRNMAVTMKLWDKDKLIERIETLRKWLENGVEGKPAVIYVHCEHGMDRTGEVTGAYMLHHMRQTFKQVVEFNDVIGVRPMQPWNKRSLQWYCLYLQYTGRGGAPGDDCGIPAGKLK